MILEVSRTVFFNQSNSCLEGNMKYDVILHALRLWIELVYFNIILSLLAASLFFLFFK